MKRFFEIASRPLIAIAGLGILFFIFRLCTGAGTESKEDESYKAYFLSRYKVFGLTIPADLNFAGEPVPLNDFTVYENMDRELTSNVYFQSSTLLLHKRASRWFPVIEPILKRNGIPDDFKYVPIIESNLTNSISPKGATGFWQIMDVAAGSFGLEVNEEVDERYNVEKSTEGSCKYFKEAYGKFHNWTLVLASFNYGINGLQKLLDEQKAKGYYDLLLNEETTRYIFRLLTIKELINHPKNYGFEIRKKDLYPPLRTYTITVDSSVTDFVRFAQKFNLSYKMLKYFNPWLRKDHLTNPEKKRYELIIPKAGYNEGYFVDINDISREGDSTKYFLEKDTLKKK
jgi:membrane-bound lytic murein transglycosylase D